jgi:transporter family-2 protein
MQRFSNEERLMSTYVAFFCALAAGGLIALQFAVNSALRADLGRDSPLFATLVSYAVGTLASLLCIAVARPALPEFERVAAAPWWAWTGGVIGVGYVTASVVLAPRLGATAFIFLVVTGQLALSLALDHYGLFGYAVRPISLSRLVGFALMIAGVLLISRGEL